MQELHQNYQHPKLSLWPFLSWLNSHDVIIAKHYCLHHFGCRITRVLLCRVDLYPTASSWTRTVISSPAFWLLNGETCHGQRVARVWRQSNGMNSYWSTDISHVRKKNRFATVGCTLPATAGILLNFASKMKTAINILCLQVFGIRLITWWNKACITKTLI